MHKVILPPLGEDINEAAIAAWLVSAGARVEEDDDIVELVTDKAVFNVPAPVKGIVREICYTEGSKVPIGATLALIEPMKS